MLPREAVLREFSSLCAICEGPDPHLHHIDENPTHNDALNLIPLCANCHLSGQHHETRRIHPGILRLFRRWKVPGMLSPQFQSLWARVEPLYDQDSNFRDMRDSLGDLIDFCKTLSQGEYFASQVGRLIPSRIGFGYLSLSPEPEHVLRAREREEAQRRAKEDAEDRETLLGNREEVERLIAELVQFQGWKRDETKKAGTRPAEY